MIVAVHGICPSCGQRRLFVNSGSGGILQCLNKACKYPNAANEIINDPVRDHLMVLDDKSWTVIHPLIERLGNRMLDCKIGDRIAEVMEESNITDHGVFRVIEHKDGDLQLVGLP